MKRLGKIITLAMMLTAATTGVALATPSTQIWIPSTDIQPYGTFHLNIDNYVRVSKAAPDADGNRARVAPTYVIGPTVGILPFEKLQAEVGFDYINQGSNTLDNHPFYFHAKVGTPEDSLFKNSPALAIGGYNFGTKNFDVGANYGTKQNMVYALVAKTLPAIGPVPSLGRLSAGYYRGSKHVLVDENGKAANDGLLLSWDRTMSEISDKLWAAVDYQGGHNANGALNFGVSWAFSKNVSVIFGYDIYLQRTTGGPNTFTTQVDINFP